MKPDTKTDPTALQEAMEGYAVLLNTIGKHAADIAHARRVLFDAYRAEGFNEVQALELCKSLSIC